MNDREPGEHLWHVQVVDAELLGTSIERLVDMKLSSLRSMMLEDLKTRLQEVGVRPLEQDPQHDLKHDYRIKHTRLHS